MIDVSGYSGKQIGNYYITAELNRGSYGTVYLGKHIIFEDDPVVAIKVLHTDLNSPQEQMLFIREAQLLKKLKHPFILPIIDAGIHDSLPYIVMEYASHGSLRDHLNQGPNKPLQVEEALTILSQLGQALEYAHQQGIVHRDLKPENILFNEAGEALLADFGIAAILAKGRTTEIGQGGTPTYMAPEQFEGTVSTKSDQYALGCIAYELITGKRPFVVPNPSIEAFWYQHTRVNPVPPTHFNPHLPVHIELAILKALTKQRADRHANVSTFISALQIPDKQQLQENKAPYKFESFEEISPLNKQASHFIPNYGHTNLSLHSENDDIIVDAVSQEFIRTPQLVNNERNTVSASSLSSNGSQSSIKVPRSSSKKLALISIGLASLLLAGSFGLFYFNRLVPSATVKGNSLQTHQTVTTAITTGTTGTSSIVTRTPAVFPTSAPDKGFKWCSTPCTSNSFIVEYPSTWNEAQTSDQTEVQFINPRQQDEYAAFKVSDTQGNARTVLDTDLQHTYSTQPGYTPPTSRGITTLGGVIWDYAIAYFVLNNSQEERVEDFATIHKGHAFIVELQAADSQFDAMNSQYFAIMLGRYQF